MAKTQEIRTVVNGLLAMLNKTPSSDLKMLLNGVSNGPEIRAQTVALYSKISFAAMYIAYLQTFAPNKYRVHKFEDLHGDDVIAIEENFSGAFCVYYVKRGEILVGENPETGIPMIVMLALAEEKAATDTFFEADYKHFPQNNLDSVWKADKDCWRMSNSEIHVGLGQLTKTLDRLKSSKEIVIKKITFREEVVLPMECEPLTSLLRSAKTLEEFEKAQNVVWTRRKEDDKVPFEQAFAPLNTSETMDETLKSLIPTTDDPLFQNGFVVEEWMVDMLRSVNNPIRPAKNLILYGPSGSGKSTAAVFLALVLGRPLWAPKLASSDMTEESLFGSWKFVNGVPEFHLSSVMNCLKYGGVVEIQEVATVRNAGVLTALNNALEPSGKIRIEETGEEFLRHPDSIVLMTTNLNYAGCRDVNISVVSRQRFTLYVPKLTKEVLVDRIVKTQPQIALEKEYIELMAECFIELCKKSDDLNLYGDTSYRTFLDWVADTYLYGDPQKAAKYTIFDKLCFAEDAEAKADLKEVIELKLQEKPVNRYDDPFEERYKLMLAHVL